MTYSQAEKSPNTSWIHRARTQAEAFKMLKGQDTNTFDEKENISEIIQMLKEKSDWSAKAKYYLSNNQTGREASGTRSAAQFCECLANPEQKLIAAIELAIQAISCAPLLHY